MYEGGLEGAGMMVKTRRCLGHGRGKQSMRVSDTDTDHLNGSFSFEISREINKMDTSVPACALFLWHIWGYFWGMLCVCAL